MYRFFHASLECLAFLFELIQIQRMTYIILLGQPSLIFSYIFKEEVDSVFCDKEFTSFFTIKGQTHPLILKEFLRKNISIETLVILDKILGFKKNFDKKLSDPVWISVSMKLEKYSPFLNIDIFKYKKILKKVVLGE